MLYTTSLKDSFFDLSDLSQIKPPAQAGEIADPLLRIKQQLLDERAIPLIVNPQQAKPFEWTEEKRTRYTQQFKPSEEQSEQARAHQQKIHEVVCALTAQLNFISQEKFNTALKECVENVNDHLASQGNLAYSVGMWIGKSNQWVASLATQYLTQMPHSFFTLDSDLQGTHGIDIPEQRLSLDHVKETTLVLFDDISYSGKQLSSSISYIQDAVRQLHLKINLLVVVPFISKKALSRLQERMTDHPETEIFLFTGKEMIPSVAEVLPAETLHILGHGGLPIRTPEEQTLTFTQWRLPDETSFASSPFMKSRVIRYIKEGSRFKQRMLNPPLFKRTEFERPYAYIKDNK